MLRKVPSFEALEVFVRAAHRDSFRAVAHEMALSPSVVTRRIAGLEDYLGVTLFERSERGVRLSLAGEKYLRNIEPAVETIGRSTESFSLEKDNTVRVACSHSLASCWLMQRTLHARQTHDLQVEIVIARNFDVLRSGRADFAVWAGLPTPADMLSQTLFSSKVTPVSAAMMEDSRPAPRTVQDLAECVLLYVTDPGNSWPNWLESKGWRGTHPLRFREYAAPQLMYEAAKAGIGVAMALAPVANMYLQSVGLQPCLPASEQGDMRYQLYHPRGAHTRSALHRRFCTWLSDEAKAACHDFDLLAA